MWEECQSLSALCLHKNSFKDPYKKWPIHWLSNLGPDWEHNTNDKQT